MMGKLGPLQCSRLGSLGLPARLTLTSPQALGNVPPLSSLPALCHRAAVCVHLLLPRWPGLRQDPARVLQGRRALEMLLCRVADPPVRQMPPTNRLETWEQPLAPRVGAEAWSLQG